jgi:putative MATE family efflux protein
MMSKDGYLITDAPLKALTVFALPMILGSFFQQVYNMADSIIVGQYVGSSALAAVGACAALTNVFICVALGAGVGAGVLVSRYYGSGNYSRMKTIVSTSLISFLILSVFLGVFGFCFSHLMLGVLQTPVDILDEAVLYLRVYFVGFPFLFMYNILSTMFTSIGESKIPLALLIFSSVLNILMDIWMVAGLGLGVFGAAVATLIAQGISAILSLVIFFCRMRRYKSSFRLFDGQELRSMLKIAVPSVLQQSTVSVGMMIVQAVVNPFGTQALAGYAATMRVENVFSLIFVSIGNAVSPYVSQNLGAGKIGRIRKGYHAALVLDICFAVLAFAVIETLHTPISSLFLGKDGTAFAYQVSGDYMRWLGYFFIFMGIKMATDGVLRGLGIMRPFLAANMVNLAIRLAVALICAPRFGIEFVWLAVPAGWLANFLISYAALRKSWPVDEAV